jgi:hypothetical protein
MAQAVSARTSTAETQMDAKGHVGLVVDKVALRQVYLRPHRSTPVSPFHNASLPRRCMTAGKQHR